MILVLGGTSDSLKICDRLNEIGISDFVLSVATEFGKDLALEHAKNIINGKMDKKEMIEYIKNQYRDNWLKNQGDPSKVITLMEKINPGALLIGFGRRFATYKRAHLLFTDLDRLAKIVNNDKCPIQFVFTGKAHPADGGAVGRIASRRLLIGHSPREARAASGRASARDVTRWRRCPTIPPADVRGPNEAPQEPARLSPHELRAAPAQPRSAALSAPGGRMRVSAPGRRRGVEAAVGASGSCVPAPDGGGGAGAVPFSPS